VENDEWLSVPNLEHEIKRYQSYAQVQMGELQEIKVEIPAQDLQFLQALANQTKTPLQAIIANVLHQFAVHISRTQTEPNGQCLTLDQLAVESGQPLNPERRRT
jgi:hypothetical protein